MRETSASIDIEATPDLVWRIVADTDLHPTFDQTTSRIGGPSPDEGVRLKVYSTLSPDRPLVVRVMTFAPPRRMVWRTSRALGFVRGERIFAVDPLNGPRTRFALTERWSGRLLPLVVRSLPDMQEAFDGFCRGLKELAEAAMPRPRSR